MQNIIWTVYKKLTARWLSRQTMREVDLTYLKLLGERSVKELSDPLILEREVLEKTGLNDERPEMFPEKLRGFGLFQAQYPVQFSKYLVTLGTFPIKSYIEVGVRHGGTFLITVSYLKRLHRLETAIAVDLSRSPGIIQFAETHPEVTFLQMDSQSAAFSEFIETHAPFDVAFIDADHDEAECMHDFYTFKDKANIIVLHDIVSETCPGVVAAWNKIKALYGPEYRFYEFIDQYADVYEKTGKIFLGIGMAVKRNVYG